MAYERIDVRRAFMVHTVQSEISEMHIPARPVRRFYEVSGRASAIDNVAF